MLLSQMLLKVSKLTENTVCEFGLSDGGPKFQLLT